MLVELQSILARLLKRVSGLASWKEVVDVERKGKSRKSNGRPISGFLPSGIDMLEQNFVDGRAVQEYLRKKVEQNPQVHRANKKLYLDWVHTLLAESLSFSRVLKYAQVLITFERFLRKPFRQATRRDLEE